TETDQQQFQTQFQAALRIWPECCQQLPEEWLEENESTTAFDEEVVLKQLHEDAAGKIWRNI
ncbi:MAG: HipA family kinase, partial [Thiolinea sp.]